METLGGRNLRNSTQVARKKGTKPFQCFLHSLTRLTTPASNPNPASPAIKTPEWVVMISTIFGRPAVRRARARFRFKGIFQFRAKSLAVPKGSSPKIVGRFTRAGRRE